MGSQDPSLKGVGKDKVSVPLDTRHSLWPRSQAYPVKWTHGQLCHHAFYTSQGQFLGQPKGSIYRDEGWIWLPVDSLRVWVPDLLIPGPEGLGWQAHGPHPARAVHFLSGTVWFFFFFFFSPWGMGGGVQNCCLP